MTHYIFHTSGYNGINFDVPYNNLTTSEQIAISSPVLKFVRDHKQIDKGCYDVRGLNTECYNLIHHNILAERSLLWGRKENAIPDFLTKFCNKKPGVGGGSRHNLLSVNLRNIQFCQHL